jgi:hypothetical protein
MVIGLSSSLIPTRGIYNCKNWLDLALLEERRIDRGKRRFEEKAEKRCQAELQMGAQVLHLTNMYNLILFRSGKPP